MPGPARQVPLADAAATEALGGALARAVADSGATSLVVLLRGDLGAGKTTLARGFLRALGHGGPVPSPTYTLLEPYRLDGLSVNHLDLYRLADAGELEFLGWRDLDGSVRLVEWPERADDAEREGDLDVGLTIAGGGRRAVLTARSGAGAAVLAALDVPHGGHQI